MSKVIKASGNEVEPYWPLLFSKALKTAKIEDLLTSMASAGGSAAGPAVAGAAAAEAAPVEEEKKEEAEDVDMGGLFGDDEDDY